MKVWATTDITFEAFTFNPTFPLYLFGLSGLIDAEFPQALHVVRSTWESSQLYDELSTTFAKDPDYPSDTAPTQQGAFMMSVFRTLINTLAVTTVDNKLSGGIPAPRFNVFARIPTCSPETWRNVRRILESTTYSSPVHGTAIPVAKRQCTYCKCLTHPRGLCPFPEVDSWKGPPLNGAQTFPEPAGPPPAMRTYPGRRNRRIVVPRRELTH
ncbi:hypothetical protein JVU11DRAFT_9201 [Chiua virens]|nr:hypothetical protein JVU11DRAFT_9201 [Chiua virens]